MQDFEKLGVFYMGKEFDLVEKQLKDDMILLKSKDLTTHAVIIGMTGSGKTGLGIGLIEEAMVDNIPVIAIDPKGDLGNLALTFPQLRAEDFRPWINLQEASNKGVTPDEYAQGQADLWKKGLAEWGQDGTRIEKLKIASDVHIYTPGGHAGIGVSVLKSFKAPSANIVADQEAFKDRINVTANSLLSLVGVDADPFTSREYILISNLLEHGWRLGQDISLSDLIQAIQKPPMDKVGVLDLESFYPAKERFGLAMMLNNLIASPGFDSWLEGVPMDVNRFLYDDKGKPQVSVFSIAHLGDRERMFFVTMLLNEILAWVRTQPGTGSLRAIVYMDELFGYLPPTANPPSKAPLLTLLKQARAFGVGMVLSTQNPVDLDYKALSNAGTWFIGRLQTERDKARVLEGLEGAAAGGTFDKGKTEQILAGLGQRIFYLHSVHEDEPVIFNTRWTMSYLAGPLTKEQIASLPKASGMNTSTGGGVMSSATAALATHSSEATPTTGATSSSPVSSADRGGSAPVIASEIKQVFLPLGLQKGVSSQGPVTYQASVIGIADVLYTSTKHNIAVTKSYMMTTPIKEGPITIDWNDGTVLDLDVGDLEERPVDGAEFMSYPSAATNAKNYEPWKKLFNQFIRTNMSLKLFSCPDLKLVSDFDEDERAFKIRLQHAAHEQRDEDLEEMKRKYEAKIQVLENRHQRAEQQVEKKNTLASQKKMDAMVSTGSAILGALFGRKKVSATSVSKIGTAVRSTSRAMKSGEGIDQAKEVLETVETQLEDLNLELEEALNAITEKYDRIVEQVEEIEVRATGTNITIHLVGLGWVPTSKG